MSCLSFKPSTQETSTSALESTSMGTHTMSSTLENL